MITTIGEQCSSIRRGPVTLLNRSCDWLSCCISCSRQSLMKPPANGTNRRLCHSLMARWACFSIISFDLTYGLLSSVHQAGRLTALVITCHVTTRDGRILIFSRIPDSDTRHLISGRSQSRIRIFDVTTVSLYLQQNTGNRIQLLFFCNP